MISGDKFIASDKDTGEQLYTSDKFIAGDNDNGD
jgi:hypothetical protein